MLSYYLSHIWSYKIKDKSGGAVSYNPQVLEGNYKFNLSKKNS